MRQVGTALILAALGLLLFTVRPGVMAQKAVSKSKEWKIHTAMSAAPIAIAKDATIMDYPEKEGGELVVLRKGTNDWTCFWTCYPDGPGDDPICVDKMALLWVQAWMSKTAPKLTADGIGYMLRGGSSPSNTDPFLKKPAAGERWMREPPHIMIFPAGKLDPKVYSSDPHWGGPWIMFGGTPYEHVMVPVK